MMFVKTSDLPRLDQAQIMADAQKKHGVSITRQAIEMMRLQKGQSALSAYEYLYYRLYDPRLTWEQKLRFAGTETSHAIYLLANEFTWWNAAEDKLSFHATMSAQALPTPRLHAVASRRRRFGSVANLPDAAAVTAWLRQAPLPTFGKPMNASHGVGAIQIVAVDPAAGTFRTDAGETHSIDEFAREIAAYVETDGYMFQEALSPHPDISRLTGGRLSTLRAIVLLGPDGPRIHRIICRLPAGENRVDNFRRPGNLIALVDPTTGVIERVCRGVGPDLEVLERHPDTDEPLAGVTLPFVAASVDLALEAAASFPGLHIQSWDIALCERGPVLLEMNPGGNLNLVQLCSGEGALTPEFQAFVRWCESLKLNTEVGKRDLARKRAA